MADDSPDQPQQQSGPPTDRSPGQNPDVEGTQTSRWRGNAGTFGCGCLVGAGGLLVLLAMAAFGSCSAPNAGDPGDTTRDKVPLPTPGDNYTPGNWFTGSDEPQSMKTLPNTFREPGSTARPTKIPPVRPSDTVELVGALAASRKAVVSAQASNLTRFEFRGA